MQNLKEKKKVESDHYRVLDLPTGKEGTKLNEKQITKAYRRKAFQLHPDKRPNDPDANAKFQSLQSSYATLMDPHARKVFDASLLRLDNKPSSSKPKKQTSSSFEPNNEEDEFPVLGFLYCSLGVIASMMYRASVRAAVFSGSGVFLLSFATGCLLTAHFLKPNPPSAATDQESESRREDHEDIEDWVLV